MEGVERHTQSYSGYRDWLGPDLTRNKRGRYMPILPVAVALLTPPGQNIIDLFTTGYLFLGVYYIMYMFYR